MKILIRQISKDDADAIMGLSSELGYSLSADQTLQNIRLVLENDWTNAFVATHDNTVVGWVGVAQGFQVESLPFCEIRGLVVAEKLRGLGIGKMLVEKAKQWGREKGNDKLRLRCNIKRSGAHLFYNQIGFKEIKQQKVFEIDI